MILLRGLYKTALSRWCGVAIALASIAAPGCAVRRTTKVNPSLVPPPSQQTTLTDLVGRVNAWSSSIRTLIATTDLEPQAGSVYSGVIREYHDVKGFILLEKPATIRILGQAPIVRTKIFDMVSNGDEFRVYVAPKEKFIVGKNASRRPAKNALENLRPQHILDALLVPAIDPSREKVFPEEAEEGGRRYYVVNVLEAAPGGDLALRRKVWFDRSSLEIARMQIYGPQGSYTEGVEYSEYRDFQGVRYPTRVHLNRPIEDYSLTITVQKATFNQPIEAEKFLLEKPEKAQLVDLTASAQAEGPGGQ